MTTDLRTRPRSGGHGTGAGPRVGPGAATAVGLLALAALIGLVWVGFVAPIPHFDVDVFLRAGAAVADGRDPYPPPGTPEVYSGFAFVYPYLMSLPFVPLSALPGADEVFIALSVVALFAACRLAHAGWWAFALVLGASCTITGLQMGTLNALLFCGLVALWRLRDSPLAAGVLAALLVYSKLFLIPVVLWLAVTRRPRAVAAAAATLGVLFAAGELVSPVPARTYVDMLAVLAREEAPDGLSLTGLLMNTGVGLDVATWAARVVAGVLLVGCLWYARRWRDAPPSSAPNPVRTPPDSARTPAPGDGRAGGDGLVFAGVVAAALVASPIVWSHYLLLLVAPLLAIARGPARVGAARGGHPDRPLALFTAGSWLLVTPHLSTPTDLFLAAAVLGPLVAVPVLRPALRRGAGRPGARPAVARAGVAAGGPPGWPGRLRRAASSCLPVAVAAAPATMVVGLVGWGLWALARAHGDDQRVIGAYGALVGMVTLLAWAVRASRPTDATGGSGGGDRLGRRVGGWTGPGPSAGAGPAPVPAPAAGATRTRSGRMHPQ